MNIFLSQVSEVTKWILLFVVLVVMYYVGKKLDVEEHLKSIIVSMLIGGFIGYFLVELVSLPIYFTISQTEVPLKLVVESIAGVFYTSLETTSSLFFASFTAIAIAQLKKLKQSRT